MERPLLTKSCRSAEGLCPQNPAAWRALVHKIPRDFVDKGPWPDTPPRDFVDKRPWPPAILWTRARPAAGFSGQGALARRLPAGFCGQGALARRSPAGFCGQGSAPPRDFVDKAPRPAGRPQNFVDKGCPIGKIKILSGGRIG